MSDAENKSPERPGGPGYIETIGIVLLLLLLVLFGYDRMFAQKVVVVDLAGYLRTQKALLAAKEISVQQWKDNLDHVEKSLNDHAGNNPNHVVILKEVVLRNGREINVQ
jgi:hypothetical protein